MFFLLEFIFFVLALWILESIYAIWIWDHNRMFPWSCGLVFGCMLGNVVGGGNGKCLKQRWVNIVLFVYFTGGALYALLWDTVYGRSDYVMLLIFVGILYYLLSDNEISRFLNRIRFSLIGSVSYTMFLVHHVIAVMFDHYDWFRDWNWKIASMAYLVMVVVCALLLRELMVMAKTVREKGNRNV